VVGFPESLIAPRPRDPPHDRQVVPDSKPRPARFPSSTPMMHNETAAQVRTDEATAANGFEFHLNGLAPIASTRGRNGDSYDSIRLPFVPLRRGRERIRRMASRARRTHEPRPASIANQPAPRSASHVGRVLGRWRSPASARRRPRRRPLPRTSRPADVPARHSAADLDGNMITLPAEDEQGKPQEARGSPLHRPDLREGHEYEVIAQGWHFVWPAGVNLAARGTLDPDRPRDTHPDSHFLPRLRASSNRRK
jgi:hypothetical protein